MDVGTQTVSPASNLVFTMLGYAPGDLRTLPEWLALIHGDDLAGVPEMIGDVIAGRRDSYWRELRLRAKDGSWHWILAQATAAERDAQGKATRLVGTHTDINVRKLAEQRVREAALHDALTGLPNRALIFEYASLLLAAARRSHAQGSFLFVDLDRFKPINDLYGHEIGDQVLHEVARRLMRCVRDEDLVGRLGGDEFIVVLQHESDTLPANTVAQHIIDALSEPLRIGSLELSISASVGVSHFPEHGTDVDTLIRAADLAMYQTKHERGGNYFTFVPELDARAGQAAAIEARLKYALQHDRLALLYQPVIDIASGEVVGVEALVRLADEDGQAIPPDRFIPIAESAGLIGQLGDWVAREACRQHEAWRRRGLPPISIAINVSPLQFRQSGFSQRLQAAVRDASVDPACIQIEVTESTVMGNVDDAVSTLSEIRAGGIRISLDDFGTGYSSLSHLGSLPLDKLKVDQSFVSDVGRQRTSRAITEAIIALGRTLNLQVVGEGIESAEALAYLREHGCDQAQGFFVSPPLSAEDFARWFDGRRDGRQRSFRH
jgi:diguanylate cyclase (GGDEF)-like protein/PAS domain S-box-containing protein